jgi:hypothetical protein
MLLIFGGWRLCSVKAVIVTEARSSGRNLSVNFDISLCPSSFECTL